MAPQPNVDETMVVTPTEERKEKPDSEVMSIDVPAEFLVDETSASENEEKKPSSKEVTESEESSSDDVKKSPDDNLSEEDQRHLSERTQKRIRDLNDRAKRAEEENERLRSNQEDRFVKQYENTVNQNLFGDNPFENPSFGEPTPNTSNLPWDSPQQQPEEKTITMEEYQRNVLNTADIIVQARMAQLNKANEIKSDLEKIETKYSELNPDSDDYSEDTSNKISELFKNQLKADPNVRLSSFVDNIMSLRKKSEEKGRDLATNKIVEQKAEEAISAHDIEPTPDKPFEKMSLDEKEKYLKEKGLW